MEQFYLEVPSIKRKDEIIEYINEFVFYNSDINGTGSLDKILEGYTFEQALERCLNMQKEEYANKIGRCQSKTLLLIRKNDRRDIGGRIKSTRDDKKDSNKEDSKESSEKDIIEKNTDGTIAHLDISI